MTKDIIITPPPKRGWINEIAEIIGATRQTVSNAIFKNTKGPKADAARRLYYSKFKTN